MKRISINHQVIRRIVTVSMVVMLVLASVLTFQACSPEAEKIAEPSYWPTTGWLSSTPESQGFDSTKLVEALLAIPQTNIGIHSLQIVRRGYLIVDTNVYPYDGSIYHDFGSVTKSVMTTLIGIAAGQGKIDLDAPVVSFFPDRTIANMSERKERITVRHLLTMSSGLKWDAGDDEVFLNQLRSSSDWVQFALDLPAVIEPGTRYVYNSAGMHLLSAIITQVTGMTALEFAKANLFTPLDISDVNWRSDPQGYSRGWGDLSLYPHDAAKIGFLFLHQGEWAGQQIVPRSWVEAATSFQISSGGSKYENYGYGWWISPAQEEPTYFRADGRKGQRILVIPEMDLVIVVNAFSDTAFEDITPFLEAAIGNLTAPLPPNPDGVAQLEAVIRDLKQPPMAKPASLPAIASTVSGKTFVFEPNPTLIESVRLDFDSPSSVTLHLKVMGENETRVGEVGLDGVYRTNRGGIPWIARASWSDTQTLAVEYSEGPGLNNYKWQIKLANDKVYFEFIGIGVIEGTAK
jgi:CubicO group peptidase (beta-lactamase class C family)